MLNQYSLSKLLPWMVFSFLISLMLAIMPLPSVLVSFAPNWVLLILLFWSLHFSQYVGLGAAWIMGMMMDLLTGRMLGEHALCYVIVMALFMRFQRQLSIFPRWQQACVVGVLTFVAQILQIWLQALNGQLYSWHNNAYSPLTTPILWYLLGAFVVRVLQKKHFNRQRYSIKFNYTSIG